MSKFSITLLSHEDSDEETTDVVEDLKTLLGSDAPNLENTVTEIEEAITEFRAEDADGQDEIESEAITALERHFVSLENDSFVDQIDDDKINEVIDFAEKAEDDINYVDNVSVESMAKIVALGTSVSPKDAMSLEAYGGNKAIALEGVMGALEDKFKQTFSNISIYIDTVIKNAKYYYTLLDGQESTLRDLKNKLSKNDKGEVDIVISDRRYLYGSKGAVVNNFGELDKEWTKAIAALSASGDILTKHSHPVDTKPFFEAHGFWNVQKSTIDYFRYLREDVMRNYFTNFGAKKVRSENGVDYFKSDLFLGGKFVIGSFPNAPIPTISEKSDNIEAVKLVDNLSAFEGRLTEEKAIAGKVTFEKVKITEIEKLLDKAIAFNNEQKAYFKWYLKIMVASNTTFSKSVKSGGNADIPALARVIRFRFAQAWLLRRFYKFLAENTGRNFLYGRSLVDVAIKVASASLKD